MRCPSRASSAGSLRGTSCAAALSTSGWSWPWRSLKAARSSGWLLRSRPTTGDSTPRRGFLQWSASSLRFHQRLHYLIPRQRLPHARRQLADIDGLRQHRIDDFRAPDLIELFRLNAGHDDRTSAVALLLEISDDDVAVELRHHQVDD